MNETYIDHRVGTAQVGDGIEISFEEFGDPNNPAVLLITGLGGQLIDWETEFCHQIARLGYRVIRFDNRDSGLSTHLDTLEIQGSDIARLVKYMIGRPSKIPYTLVDMASDTVGLLNHLRIEKTHIVGCSMGGMIAQIVAGKHADRILSVGIIFSSTNQAFLPPPDPRKLLALMESPGEKATRQQHIESSANAIRTIGSQKYSLSQEEAIVRATNAYNRSFNPRASERQSAAVMGTGSLRSFTTSISAPTLVIHGKNDGLIRPSGGKAVARAVKGAKLVMIDDMAHDLPKQLWPRIITELATNFRKGNQRPE